MTPLRRFCRRANFMARILRARLSGRPRPLIASLAVTSRCNLKCSFCFGRYFEKKIPDLSLEEINGLIDLLAERGTAYLNLTGGEPLVREDIGAIIQRCRDRGLLTAITTNGVLIDRYLDDLTLLDFICISVDGDRFSHDRVRGDGTYKIIMDNTRQLRDRGVPVQVTCVLNRYNVESMNRLLKVAGELGFTVKLALPTDEFEIGPHNPDVNLTDEEMRSALKNVISWQRDGRPIDFSSSSYDFMLHWPRSLWDPIAWQGDDFVTPPWPCYAGKYWCHIDPDGKVYPCCLLIPDFKALDFREVGFDRAFARLADRKCITCAKIPYLEFNQLINLRLRVIAANAWRSLRVLFIKAGLNRPVRGRERQLRLSRKADESN